MSDLVRASCGTVLANRNRLPGAVLFDLARVDPEAVAGLLRLPAFGALAGRARCLGGQCPPHLEAPWRAAGGSFAGPKGIESATGRWPQALATETEWVAGDWFLAAPAKPTANHLASRSLALRLMQLVAADAETSELEAVFRQDPTLSYQLLRLVNSPGVGIGTGRRVSNFAQAILIIGRQHLRRWLNLLLFATRKDDPRAPMLLACAALRARRMELFEKARGGDRVAQDKAFMAGMFSLLGALFGTPLAEALRPLQLGAEMDAAICRCEGALGTVLALVAELDGCNSAKADALDRLCRLLGAQGLTVETLAGIHLESLAWAFEIGGEAGGAPHA